MNNKPKEYWIKWPACVFLEPKDGAIHVIEKSFYDAEIARLQEAYNQTVCAGADKVAELTYELNHLRNEVAALRAPGPKS